LSNAVNVFTSWRIEDLGLVSHYIIYVCAPMYIIYVCAK
jgi:hypothetical protein